VPSEAAGSGSNGEESAASSPLPFPSPEVIREFTDRGAQWLFEDPRNVKDLLALVDPELAQSLQFERAERINRTFIPADLVKLENDLLFRVPALSGDVAVLVYVLLEHQSTIDPWMALRLYLYIGEVWKAQRHEWERANAPAADRRIASVVPIVFYTGEDTWPQPISLTSRMQLCAGFERFVPQWETLFVSLNELRPELLSATLNSVGQALRVWQAEKLPLDELERVVADALKNLEGLSNEQAAQWARTVWFFVCLAFSRRESNEYAAIFNLVRERVKASHFQEKPDMSILGPSMADVVREEGRREGRREGRQEERRRALTIVLKARFGPIDSATEARIAAASAETLERWLVSAATARTLEEALA
jgi:predicted transposase YdaD